MRDSPKIRLRARPVLKLKIFRFEFTTQALEIGLKIQFELFKMRSHCKKHIACPETFLGERFSWKSRSGSRGSRAWKQRSSANTKAADDWPDNGAHLVVIGLCQIQRAFKILKRLNLRDSQIKRNCPCDTNSWCLPKPPLNSESVQQKSLQPIVLPVRNFFNGKNSQQWKSVGNHLKNPN